MAVIGACSALISREQFPYDEIWCLFDRMTPSLLRCYCAVPAAYSAWFVVVFDAVIRTLFGFRAF